MKKIFKAISWIPSLFLFGLTAVSVIKADGKWSIGILIVAMLVSPFFKKILHKYGIFCVGKIRAVIIGLLLVCTLPFLGLTQRNPIEISYPVTEKENVDVISAREVTNGIKEKMSKAVTEAKNSFSDEELQIEELEKAELIRVVDGDTLIVKSEGSLYEERVRLIGVNTPESVHPDETKNSESGKAASEYTKDILKGYTNVWLQQDVSETDTYGRKLCYVWIEEPSDTRNIEEVRNKMLNGILLRDKVAEPMAIEPDVSYKEMFDTIYYTEKE